MRKPAFAALLSSTAASAYYFGSPDMSGNSQSLLGWGSPATGTPTIAPSQFRPGQGPGKAIGMVDGFSGQPAYSVSLGGLNALGVIAYPIVVNYGGPTRPLFDADRYRGGTYTSNDDVIFADLGPFGGGQPSRPPQRPSTWRPTPMSRFSHHGHGRVQPAGHQLDPSAS